VRSADDDTHVIPAATGGDSSGQGRGGAREAERSSDAEAMPAVRSRSAAAGMPAGARPDKERRPRRYPIRLGVAVGLLALALVLWSTGPVQAVIRQSFTRIPTSYTELYFTSTPQLNGLDLTVPITVDAHYINVDSFTVKVWLTNAAGKTDYSTTLQLKAVHGIARTVQNVQLPVNAEILWVNLSGQSRTLHYRVAGSPLTTSPG